MSAPGRAPIEGDFADRIVRDHQSAEAQVQTYAKGHKIDLADLGRRVADMSQEQIRLERRSRAVGSATGEWAWTWEHAVQSSNDDRTEMGKLRKLKGPGFDREFTRAMVSDHRWSSISSPTRAPGRSRPT